MDGVCVFVFLREHLTFEVCHYQNAHLLLSQVRNACYLAPKTVLFNFRAED
jgi:hypothetical protein